ncbi:acetylxylan esterase [Sinomicrobium weinanense]|uniref:Acetylxylan esterase n=1 Tax=Sinomicrobium weinanense TaxID=2842200 RepID=A0A926JTH2_9FLAO|nr:acetylxylan esterase [Sinomicrobium weinanense]MBC9797235.1 acetylxylan esterase [Sinomicrobium weinanense]MBU3125552.1 acetylxylan esterase [Sinomicrobium weinanense]
MIETDLFNVFKRSTRIAVLCIVFWVNQQAAFAQSTAGIDVENSQSDEFKDIELAVSAGNEDWVYALGEEVVFNAVLSVDGAPSTTDSISFAYTIGPEKMPAISQGTVVGKNGRAEIRGGTMRIPGFLRCKVTVEVDGQVYEGTATAAFEPEKIEPTAIVPADFDRYWKTAIKKSRSIPLAYQLTPIPERQTASVDVYQVAYRFFNEGPQTFYGVLSMPRRDGKYPAIIRFPGAGWAPLSGDQKTAEKGFITLDLYIHGRPVIEDRSYYDSLKDHELKDYMYKGISDRDAFYYKNVILGCVRSVDLIHALPQFDGENLGAWGSSQGGALSIITTSLEHRIDRFVALCPAMCDFTGYLHGRAGGWPHFFNKPELYKDNKEEVLRTLSYYDVVNFAKQIRVPGFFSWGFNDPTTPPTSFYSAYNAVPAAKKVLIIPPGVHKIYPEQREKTYSWLTGAYKYDE